MARHFDNVKDINDSKGLWKIAIRVADVWSVVNKSKKEHLEMVFMDAKGDRIQVVVPKEDVGTIKTKLLEQSTYILQNVNVFPNDFQFKVADHPYKLVINAGAIIKQKHIPDIPPTGFQFKDFNDILNGNFQADLLVDIIGAIHKMGYSQPMGSSQPDARPKKVAFTIKDASGKFVNCTLWDDYARKLLSYLNGRTNYQDTIIILTHANIKPAEGKFAVSISNYWDGSKLLINEDIVEVQDFKKSLLANESHEQSSQMLSQFSGSSQFSDLERFMYNAQVKSIAQINAMQEDTTCVTFGTTGKFIVSKNGWSYEGCTSYTRKATKMDVGYKCASGHYSENPVPRYKLEISVYHNKDNYKFIFWDTDCAKMYGKSALELMTKMFEDGEDDKRAYPNDLDHILARTLAMRVKVEATSKQASVIKVEDDPQTIQTIMEQLQTEEHTSKAEKPKSDVNEDVQFHTQSLSATTEHDPELLASMTPAKRISSEVQSDGMLNPELENAQLSSTKITKQFKIE